MRGNARAAALILGAAAIAFAGCVALIGRGSPVKIAPKPYNAALYLSPELDGAEVQVVMPDGARAVEPVGAYLRDEIMKATGDAFAAAALIDGPRFTGSLRRRDLGRGAWPETENRDPVPPDLVVACYLSRLEACALPGERCAECEDGLFLRVDLHIEIRDPGGSVVSSATVTGRGVSKAGRHLAATLSTRFREVVASAAEVLAGEYRLALAGADIELPTNAPVPSLDERHAEAD